MKKLLQLLVLEDNPADFGLIRRVLQKMPEYTVELVHFADPEEAFAYLVDNEVDCLLLDYLLGAVNGLDFLKRLRDLGNDTPVVLLTGFGNEMVAVEALQQGAQDYLVKGSLTLQSLQRAISNSLQQVDLQRQLAMQQSNLRQFVAVASHDIKSPLNRIRLLGEALKDEVADRLNPDETEFLDEMLRNAEHLLGFLDALLKHTRDGSQEEQRRDVDMNAIFAQAKTFLANQMAEAHAEIEIEELPQVYGEPFALLQIAQNLVANALKYRLEERPTRIKIWADPAEGDSNFHRFHVKDNGIGISPRFHEKIFKPMTRLHNQQVYTGYGLGLATCKKVVERHGGQIWVDASNTEDEGTTFCFTLPVNQPKKA